jgi:hypothetical protein
MARAFLGRLAAVTAAAALSLSGGSAALAVGRPTAVPDALPATTNAAAPAASIGGPAGVVRSLVPARLLDTRYGNGAPVAKVAPHGTVHLRVTGRGGVPAAGVGAVVLNVTVVGPASSGYLTVYPDGTTRPTASNLNFSAGQTVPNLVMVQVGAGVGVDGKVALFNGSAGTVNLVADVAGYVVAGSPTVPGGVASLVPTRILDTRHGNGAPATRVAAHSIVHLQVTGRGGVPAAGVGAVVLNVTAVRPASTGYLTVYPSDKARPTASNLNFVAGQTVPNLVTVRLSGDGRVALFNGSAGTVDLVADVAGYVLAGTPTDPGAVASLVPARVLDTRYGNGAPASRVAAHGTVHLQVTGRGGVPASGVGAVLLNVTAVRPSTSGYVTVYPNDQPRPTASNLNFVAGRTVPNQVMVRVGGDGQVALHNGSSGSVDLLADVAGYILEVPPVTLTWAAASVVDPPRGDLSAISCPTTDFCVGVDVHGNALEWDGSAWSVPQRVDPDGGGFTDLSCPSADFCAAVDSAGNVLTLTSSTWAIPQQVDPNGFLVDVSCTSSTFCLALDQFGNVTAYDGSTWSTPVTIGLGAVSALDCASTTFCAAVDGIGRALTYDGTTWSAPNLVSADPFGTASVSCPTQTFCAAVNEAGNAVTFTGTAWTSPVPTHLAAGPFTVTCDSGTFCLATDSDSTFSRFNGSGWSAAAPSPFEAGLVPVSCAGDTFCVGVDIANVAVFDGSAWGIPEAVDPDVALTAVSCASETFCVLVDSGGRASVYNGVGYSAFTDIDAGGVLTSVSCPTDSFCAAVDDAGYVLTYNGSSWGAPELIAPAGGLTSVSCPSGTFCATVSTPKDPLTGYAQTFNGTAWTTPSHISDSNLVSVSCSSTTFCAAIDNYSGTASTFDGGGWSAPAEIDPVGYTSAVSCPETPFCVAVGDSGTAELFTGIDWTAPLVVDDSGALTSVSCATDELCVAVGGSGDASVYNGSTWTPPNVVTTNGAGFVGVSCPTDSFCLAIDDAGGAMTAQRS